MPLLRTVWIIVSILVNITSLLNAQSEYKYSYVPKTVYENQVFPLTVVGPDDLSAVLTFDRSSPVQPLQAKPLLVKNANDTFYTFYFKAGKINVRVPRLFISSNEGDFSLDHQFISLSTLNLPKYFCGVLAAELKIKNSQVSNFDGTNHMITLQLEAYEANLEDMVLKESNDSGIENIERDNAKVTAEFYAVLPREQKELKFSYFNTIKQRYITLSVPVKVADASVTTQSDLNPKVDAFERLKRYTLIALSLFFIVMFIMRRDFFYLVLGAISIITLLTFYIPHKKVCVTQGAPLYIIPTQTSTVSTIIENQVDTLVLGTRGKYSKIEYKKGIIGWIKNEDLCDN